MTINQDEQSTPAILLSENQIQEYKRVFSSILSRPSFMDQVDIPSQDILKEKAQKYLRVHNQFFELLPRTPVSDKHDYSFSNLQTNFLFGSSEASELRLMFFGFKPAVLGGDRYNYRELSAEQAPENLKGAFAIIRATREYPHIQIIDYLEPGEGLVDGVAFDPVLEQQVIEMNSDIFQKIGYDLTKPIPELVKEIFQGGNDLAISLALGYSLGSAIFSNVRDLPNPKTNERSKELWSNLEKILDKDQVITTQEIAKELSEGLSYHDFAKKLGLPTRQEDNYRRLEKAWEDSGLASILDKARKKFYSPEIYRHIKDLF